MKNKTEAEAVSTKKPDAPKVKSNAEVERVLTLAVLDLYERDAKELQTDHRAGNRRFGRQLAANVKRWREELAALFRYS